MYPLDHLPCLVAFVEIDTLAINAETFRSDVEGLKLHSTTSKSDSWVLNRHSETKYIVPT